MGTGGGAVSGGLSTRKLPRGPHALTREEVARNQRSRLLGGMIEAVGEKGYLGTTVADVIANAGVSRKAFYEHFPNKQECFLRAYDVAVARGLARVRAASESAHGARASVDAALESIFSQALKNPHAVRLTLVEIGAVGREGVPRRERQMAALETVLRTAMALSGPAQPGPDPVMRGIVGGINDIVNMRVRRGEQHKLRALEPELASWMDAYHPAPKGVCAALARAEESSRAGGRAPGTLSPMSPSSPRRGLRGDHRGSHSFVVHNQRERVLDAVTNLSAEKGYAGITVRDVAERAAVSLDAFYEHFIDKEDAFLVAYEVGHGRCLAIVEHAYRSAPEWRSGIRAATKALFDFLASEPSFARLTLVDALVASPRSAERARIGVGAYAQMLAPGVEEMRRRGQPRPIAIEAIVGGILELCLTFALQGRVEELPGMVGGATYFALAPFVGAEEAARTAVAPGDVAA